MIIFKKAADIRYYLDKAKQAGKSIGFVPTMGALHPGHISLIDRSVGDNGVTVSSIFVNPTQFNNASDLAKYPVTIEKDIEMLEAAGCTLLFLPSVEEVYPNGTEPAMHYDLGYLETILEGKYRPGHFQGVCQVVHRLLEIVMPATLYLGQKDYQQCMVIKKLISLMGWSDTMKLSIVPTMREANGLAMSSRNMRLSQVEKEQAVKISRTLSFIKKEIRPGYLNDLKLKCIDHLNTEGFKVDYVEIAGADDLQPVEEWNGKRQLVALVAAFLGEVRLIDNMRINGELRMDNG